MKVFQIIKGFCHWDATNVHPTLEDTKGKYAPETKFVEAPDYVFETWGYDESQTGDDRFIKPVAAEPNRWTDEKTGKTYHWEYDDTSGTFYIADDEGNVVTP